MEARNTIRSSLSISPMTVMSSVSVPSVPRVRFASMTDWMSPSGLPHLSKSMNRMIAPLYMSVSGSYSSEPEQLASVSDCSPGSSGK